MGVLNKKGHHKEDYRSKGEKNKVLERCRKERISAQKRVSGVCWGPQPGEGQGKKKHKGVIINVGR